MLRDSMKLMELFHANSPTLARCEEGDLPLLNFFNLDIYELDKIKNFLSI